jgi:hypothetical protein
MKVSRYLQISGSNFKKTQGFSQSMQKYNPTLAYGFNAVARESDGKEQQGQ